MVEVKRFGRVQEVMAPPNLMELQLNSYAIHPRSWFRASFEAGEARREIRLPFSAFASPLAGIRLDPARLRALLFRLEGEPGGGAWLELGNIRFYR